MSRHVNLVVPHEFGDRITHLLYGLPQVHKIVRFNTFTTVHISFKLQAKHLQEVIIRLGGEGCGETYGTIDVFACLLTRPLLQVKEAGSDNKKTHKYSVSDRLTVDEIEDFVEDGNHLTFDYMAQIGVASVIAGIGLITDSATVVIAAMLVSPLMGPILSLTFGAAVLKESIIKRGLRNEVIGVAISTIVGLICGFTLYGISGTDFAPGDEMLNRGRVNGLIAGSVVAAASGMGVILALSKGGVNAIVGTSISASLLPPCVNTGICTAYVICIYFFSDDWTDMSRYRQTAVVSLVLYLMNFFLIIIVAICTLRYIKKIYPLSDPRNLPHNPDLNIPRSVISGDGDSMSSSFDMSHNDSAKTLSIQSTPDMLMNHHKKYSNTPLTSLYDVESPLLSGEALLDSETSLMVNRPTSERYFVENAADSPHAPTRQRRNLSTSKDENTEV